MTLPIAVPRERFLDWRHLWTSFLRRTVIQWCQQQSQLCLLV